MAAVVMPHTSIDANGRCCARPGSHGVARQRQCSAGPARPAWRSADGPCRRFAACAAQQSSGPDGPIEGAPWAFVSYTTKKLERRTDKLGNILQDPSTIAEPINWTVDTQLALAIKVVAGELGASEDEVRERVELLRAVLPDGGLGPGTSGLKAADLVRLACDVDGVVANLLVLRDAFPRANVSAIAARNPHLLRMAREELRESAEQFRRLLLEEGGSDPDALAEASPLLLEPGALAGVLGELRRLFGAKTPPGRLLQNAPDLALSCQSLQSQSRGERDYDYLRDIFSGGGGPMAALGGGGGGAGGGGGPGGGGGAGDSAPGCDEGAEA